MSQAQPYSETIHEVVVETIAREADHVVSLSLVSADGTALPQWEPGAHIDLILTAELERQYSLCGVPADRSAWRVAVLRERDGRGGSDWVHTRLAPGTVLKARGPRNHFPLIEAHRYFMIAGGIGITPLLPMIRQLADQGAEWSLLYGGRTVGSMAFRDELAGYGSRVIVRPEDEFGLLDISRFLRASDGRSAVYCCGPEPLLQATESVCSQADRGLLHSERFAPKPGALDGGANAFEIELDRSELVLTVASDKTIVETLEDAGIDVTTSCREGTCGTCETDVLDGVPDHRDSVLSDEDRAANDVMMICCSRSKTARLVLDL